jgi:hypothetical protein
MDIVGSDRLSLWTHARRLARGELDSKRIVNSPSARTNDFPSNARAGQLHWHDVSKKCPRIEGIRESQSSVS